MLRECPHPRHSEPRKLIWQHRPHGKLAGEVAMAVPHRSEAVGEINTLLGRGSEFEGKLTFEGTVRIDGKLSGEIFSDDVLVVGEGAEVHAEIDIGVIIVEGNVTGNVRAKKAVELHAPAKFKGNIETP